MIESRSEYRKFREADRISLGSVSGIDRLTNEIYRFQVKLRRLEYFLNCRPRNPMTLLCKILFRRSAIKMGFSISPNTFGPGLSIAHRGTIIVNGGARIGANCRLHACVNIGTAAGKSSAAPIIGNNCYIGPGVKVFGEIVIGDNTVLGANTVVNRSFEHGDQTIAGVPARVVSKKTSDGLLIRGFPT